MMAQTNNYFSDMMPLAGCLTGSIITYCRPVSTNKKLHRGITPEVIGLKLIIDPRSPVMGQGSGSRG